MTMMVNEHTIPRTDCAVYEKDTSYAPASDADPVTTAKPVLAYDASNPDGMTVCVMVPPWRPAIILVLITYVSPFLMTTVPPVEVTVAPWTTVSSLMSTTVPAGYVATALPGSAAYVTVGPSETTSRL